MKAQPMPDQNFLVDRITHWRTHINRNGGRELQYLVRWVSTRVSRSHIKELPEQRRGTTGKYKFVAVGASGEWPIARLWKSRGEVA